MHTQLPAHVQPLWHDIANVLTTFGDIQDRLDPPRLPEYIDRLEPHAQALEASMKTVDAVKAERGSPEAVLTQAGSQLIGAASRFRGARNPPHEILKAFQALRPVARANDILFPLASRFSEISMHYLTPSRRDDADLHARLAINHDDDTQRGLMHVNNQRGQRGGYSLFVPEYYSADRAWPLVIAMHGGSGHGADFLWSWLRDARAFGFILAVPTSLDRTWSLHNPGTDAAGLNRMLASISETWNIDTKHLLLTGISDGGTYTMLLSIVKQSPFTHYAPVAAAVHAMMNQNGDVTAPVKDTLVYMIHGARDWMFAIDRARAVAAALKEAGAVITYREVDDLSHNYPRDENPALLRWFCPALLE